MLCPSDTLSIQYEIRVTLNEQLDSGLLSIVTACKFMLVLSVLQYQFLLAFAKFLFKKYRIARIT